MIFFVDEVKAPEWYEYTDDNDKEFDDLKGMSNKSILRILLDSF
jgi:hypothetical protein